jgi:hypothetical protein
LYYFHKKFKLKKKKTFFVGFFGGFLGFFRWVFWVGFYWQPWLKDTENWLYEEGEDADRPAYQLRLSDLKGRGEPVKRRKREWEERPIAMNQFGQCLQLAQKVIDSFKVSFFFVVICHFGYFILRPCGAPAFTQ